MEIYANQSMRNKDQSVKPISVGFSLFVFGMPGVAIYAAVHLLVPALVEYGIPLIFVWSACVLIPTVANVIAVLALCLFLFGYAILFAPSICCSVPKEHLVGNFYSRRHDLNGIRNYHCWIDGKLSS